MEYRLPTIDDKEIIKSYIEDHYSKGERSLSASNMLTSMEYEDWVKKVSNSVDVPDKNWGKSITYLALDNDKLVGLLNIRYTLSESMRMMYGDVGYGVRPSERMKGYATKMLKYALLECKRLGMEDVILGCYKDNIGSAKTIIKNGGELIKELEEEKQITEYWKINLIRQYYKIKIK